MTVTQFKGLRGVPLIPPPGEREWSKDKQYEALTVVLHEGNSYTSAQAVPVGIDITNENFWAETGNYNAQVEAYRQEVLQYANNSQQYFDKTAWLSNHDMIILGDSFGGGLYPTSSGYANSAYGWVNYCMTHKNNHVNNIYSNADSIQVGNFGFTSSAPFVNEIIRIASICENANAIKKIVVLAGTNEVIDGNLYTALSKFVATAKSLYPNAIVYVGCIGSNIRDILVNVEPYYKAVVDYGGVYLNTLNIMNNHALVSSDNVHLSADGYQHYAMEIANAVWRGVNTFNETFVTNNLVSNSKATIKTEAQIVYKSTPDSVMGFFRGTNTPKTPELSFNGEDFNTSYLLLYKDISPNYLPNSSVNIILQGTATITQTDNTVVKADVSAAYDGLGNIYSYFIDSALNPGEVTSFTIKLDNQVFLN